MFEVETRSVDGTPTAVGSAGPFTLVVDRPVEAGGGGLGFNGGELLYLAVAGCVSNDLFREARAEGIALRTVRVRVRGDFSGEPPVSEPIEYEVELEGDAPREQLEALAARVDEIAEIPNSLRRGTEVRLSRAVVT
ncbi:MAG: OsmC family protein [Gaiellaceae bacterium]